jgi:hypothetical protein
MAYDIRWSILAIDRWVYFGAGLVVCGLGIAGDPGLP